MQPNGTSSLTLLLAKGHDYSGQLSHSAYWSIYPEDLSARAFHRVLKLGCTIADLADSNLIAANHIAQATEGGMWLLLRSIPLYFS